MRATSASSSWPLRFASSPDWTAVPPAGQLLPGGSATCRVTTGGADCAGIGLHTAVRVWTSASCSTPSRLTSRPDLTTEPPYGHSAMLAGSVRTTTGTGGALDPARGPGLSVHAAIAIAADIHHILDIEAPARRM